MCNQPLRPVLSVLIVNWNTRDLLLGCLRSIYRHPPQAPFEVIVVDNASEDGSAEAVSLEFPQVDLILCRLNHGYAAGNNMAFERAKGSYLLTLNPDTEFEDDSLQRSLDTLQGLEGYGALAVRLVGPDGKTQRSVRGFPSILGVFGASFLMDRLLPSSALGAYSLPSFDYERDGPAIQPMGTFLMFRRTALETVGDPKRPFDERFPIFFNEVDLLARLAKAGWPCWYLAGAHVRHLHGASTRQVRKSMIWESHRSLVRYFGKHLEGPSRSLLPLIAAAAWLGAFVRAKGWHVGFRTQRDRL